MTQRMLCRRPDPEFAGRRTIWSFLDRQWYFLSAYDPNGIDITAPVWRARIAKAKADIERHRWLVSMAQQASTVSRQELERVLRRIVEWQQN